MMIVVVVIIQFVKKCFFLFSLLLVTVTLNPAFDKSTYVAFVLVMKLSVAGTIYLRKREESSLLVMNSPSVLIDTYVMKCMYLLYQ